VSEGSFWPKAWKEALPLIVWGVLIFAAGFEGIASLVHGEWISSGAAFAIMLGLTAMLLHWKAWLKRVSPNWVAGGASVLLVAIAVSAAAREARWEAISWGSLGIGVLGTLLVVSVIGGMASLFVAGKQPAVVPSAADVDTQTRQEIISLLEFAVQHTTELWLTDLVMKSPIQVSAVGLKINPDVETAQSGADFVRHVSIQLRQSAYRHQDFLLCIAEAESEAERMVEQTPQDQRPIGVDPLVLRRCTIANFQCIRALEFLQRERRELGQKLIAQRSKLVEKLSTRSPS
jgi:hypothetical protein